MYINRNVMAYKEGSILSKNIHVSHYVISVLNVMLNFTLHHTVV